jgi:hypothetical protein
MTDWNYMPFRMKLNVRKTVNRHNNKETFKGLEKIAYSNDMCLTHHIPEPHGKNPARFTHGRVLTASLCIEDFYDLKKQYTNDYNTKQLFSMHPLSPIPQQILHYEFENIRRCLTVGKIESTYHVEMAECVKDRGNKAELGNQLFTIRMLQSDEEARQFTHTPTILVWAGAEDMCLAFEDSEPGKVNQGPAVHTDTHTNEYTESYEISSSSSSSNRKLISTHGTPDKEDWVGLVPETAPPTQTTPAFATLQACYEVVDGVRKVRGPARIYLERSVIKSVTV